MESQVPGARPRKIEEKQCDECQTRYGKRDSDFSQHDFNAIQLWINVFRLICANLQIPSEFQSANYSA